LEYNSYVILIFLENSDIIDEHVKRMEANKITCQTSR